MLTDAQRATLLTAIKADPAIEAIRAAGNTTGLLGWCNGDSAFSAWRKDVRGSEVYAAHKPKQYMARTAPERDGFDLMCAQATLDFTRARTRNGLAEIFSGGTDSDCRLDIFAAAQEIATRAEMVLGSTDASVGASADMSETVTAKRRNWVGRVNQADANWLVQQP
jgi:hypothetical protein